MSEGSRPGEGVVPVLVITGTVGVGKSTVGGEVFRLLSEAGVASAFVDLPAFGHVGPTSPADPWNERVAHANLACAWINFAEAGARRLIVCRVLEQRSVLHRVKAAVPGAQFTVVRLRAPLDLVQSRIRSREAGDPGWYLDAATELQDKLEAAGVEDHTVENDARPPSEVAAEILRISGWLAG